MARVKSSWFFEGCTPTPRYACDADGATAPPKWRITGQVVHVIYSTNSNPHFTHLPATFFSGLSVCFSTVFFFVCRTLSFRSGGSPERTGRKCSAWLQVFFLNMHPDGTSHRLADHDNYCLFSFFGSVRLVEVQWALLTFHKEETCSSSPPVLSESYSSLFALSNVMVISTFGVLMQTELSQFFGTKKVGKISRRFRS